MGLAPHKHSTTVAASYNVQMTSNPLYAQRRARLAAQLGAGGIAIIPTAPERPRNRDSDFLYRHDSYFYYLTGFTEPHATLVITADGETTLFCQPKDMEREVWDGIRLGPDAAPAALGVSRALPSAELAVQMPKLLENRSTVWYPFAIHSGLEGRVDGWLQSVRARVRFGALCPDQQRDVCSLLDEMRLVKDAHEQGIMRRASAISARAHCFFHQVEGLYIDKNVSFTDLKQVLLSFAKEMFGDFVYGHLLNTAVQEQSIFDNLAITDWELARYFERG